MSEDILSITPHKIPYDANAKIFRHHCCDEDDCVCTSSCYSLNDFDGWIMEIAGVSKDLLGENLNE